MPDETTLMHLRDLQKRIDEAFGAGASGRGRDLIQRALEESRGNSAYHELFRGEAARRLAGDRERQGRHIEAALEAAPDDSFLQRGYGAYLSASGADEEALQWFGRALAENPRDCRAMRRMGSGCSALGRLDEALVWYDRALEVNPASGAARNDKARALIERGDFQAAVREYDIVLG